MVTVKKVLKNAGLYTVVQILHGAIGFFMLPVYTFFLTPEDYGIVTVVNSIVSFLTILYMFGLQGAISKFHYEYVDDEEKRKKFHGTIITTIILISLVLTVFLVLTRSFILERFTKGVSFYPYMFIGLLQVTCSTLFPILQSILQMEYNGERYSVQQIIVFIAGVVLNLLFIVVFKLNAFGSLLSQLLVSIGTFSYSLYVFTYRRKIPINIDKGILKKCLKYSLPLVPHTIAGWANNLIDRIILLNLTSSAVVGIYNVGYQFGNIINIFCSAVNGAFIPWFFSMLKEKKDHTIVYKFANNMVGVYCLAALWMSYLSPPVLRLMVKSVYYSAEDIIPYIAFAYVFNGLYYFFVSGLFYNVKGTRLIFLCTTSAACLNIVLNNLFIPRYGIIGASLATTIGFAFCSLLVLIFTSFINREENIKWNYWRMYATVAAAMAFTAILKVFLSGVLASFAFMLASSLMILVIAGFDPRLIKSVIRR